MKLTLRILACCLLYIVFGSLLGQALAHEVTVSWTNATENEDGSAIPLTGTTALDVTDIDYSLCAGGQLSEPRSTQQVPANVTTVVIDLPGGGLYCFVGIHTNNEGTRSAESNVAQKQVAEDVVTPAPPGMLTVVANDLTARTLVKQPGRFILVAVGTVPGNTGCDPQQYVNGQHVVPVDLVTWTDPDGPKPMVVVANCE